MAFVVTPGTHGEAVGVITMKDIIEEILQSKILDEFDLVYDNSKSLSGRSASANNKTLQAGQLSPQMALATLRFLSTSVQAFDSSLVSECVLQHLLKEGDVLRSCCASACLQEFGEAAKSFCMVLEGRVQVLFGRDQMVFEGGPFFCFGVHSILGSRCNKDTPTVEGALEEGEDCVADCSVKALAKVQYVCIDRPTYLQAVNRSLQNEHLPLDKNIDFNNNMMTDDESTPNFPEVVPNAHFHGGGVNGYVACVYSDLLPSSPHPQGQVRKNHQLHNLLKTHLPPKHLTANSNHTTPKQPQTTLLEKH